MDATLEQLLIELYVTAGKNAKLEQENKRINELYQELLDKDKEREKD